jgi:hypothetical protein
MNKTRVLLAAVAGFMLSSCIESGVCYYSCGEVSYVTEFPHEYTLAAVEPYVSDNPDMMGLVNIKFIDSLFIGISTANDYFLSIHNINTGNCLGTFFNTGDGPDEYRQVPSIIKTYAHNDSLFADIKTLYPTEYKTMNLQASLEQHKDVFSNSTRYDNNRNITSIYPLNNCDTLLTCYDLGSGALQYSITSPDSVQVIHLPYNSSIEWSDYEYNTFAYLQAGFNNNTQIVNAQTSLNQLIIFSPYNTSNCQTICVGDRLENIKEVNNRFSRNKRRTYAGIQILDNRLALLYHGISESDYQHNKGNSEIQIFDFDMKPVARIKLPIIAITTYINQADGTLYAYNPLGDSEILYKFDVSGMLE